MSAFEHMPGAPPEPRRLTDVPHGPVLAFAPHPDDEIAGPGGALCLHRRAGDPVRVVVATDGVAGDPDRRFDQATYTERRRDESRRGLAVLGVHDVEFWGFPDSCQLSVNDLELGLQHALASLQSARPAIVYLPWAHEGHPDHHALHHVVVRALDRSGFEGLALGYEVWNAMLPDAVLEVTTVMQQKERAMLAYESQTAYVSYDHCVRGLNAYRSLVHGRGKGYWEAYCVLRGELPPG
jgi:N-acetylglucosamine malate deacetylase 1